MDLTKVKEIVLESLPDQTYSLYDLKIIHEYGQTILQILVDRKGGINLDDLAKINETVSLKLEGLDDDMPLYLLEVSSPGAEKELRNIDEIKESLGKYIHAKTSDTIFEGYLEEVLEDAINVKINQKGRIKSVLIKLSDISSIRLAVKI